MTAFTPRFPTVELALDIHAEMLSQYGGLDGVRDYAQLEAAIAAPQMTINGGGVVGFPLPRSLVLGRQQTYCHGFGLQLFGGKWLDA